MHPVHAGDIAGVVLAAGLGTRLRPLTDVVPKPLCPVANVPLVDHAIAHVRTITSSIAVNVHHHRARLEAHLTDRQHQHQHQQHLDLHLSIEEPEPLGTAGAIGRLRDWIDGRPTLIHNSDAWHADTDLASRMTDGWDGERIRLLVVAPGPLTSTADFADGTVFAGVSLNPWRDVRHLRPEPTGLWEVCWRQADEDGRIERIRYDGAWFDTGTPSAYLAANLAANRGRSVIAPDATVEDPETTVVRSVVWSRAHVAADERLHEQIRFRDHEGDDRTVDAPQPRPRTTTTTTTTTTNTKT